MKQYTVGVDIGGTNIKLGLVNRSGTIIGRAVLSTKNLSKNKKKLIDAVCISILNLVKEQRLTPKSILGIGLGLPGPVDSKRGIVSFLPNIPGWKNVPLKNIIQKRLHIPTFIDNDVNLITLGEWKFGAGKGCQNLMCMTLGTGVGAGLILNNGLYRGEGFAAGELGHMPLNEDGPACNCGGWACFERYVGNTTLLEKALKTFPNSKIQLPDVYRRAEQGDRLALRFWEEAAVHIGNALVGVINLLNLRLIIIGGGVSNSFKFLGRTINGTIKARAMKVQAGMVRVVRAQLDDDAGILGAQVLVKESMRGR
jgi:glucokinase